MKLLTKLPMGPLWSCCFLLAYPLNGGHVRVCVCVCAHLQCDVLHATSCVAMFVPFGSVECVKSLISQSYTNVVVASLCIPAGGGPSGHPSGTRRTECCSQSRQTEEAACVCLSARGVTQEVGGEVELEGGAEESMGHEEVGQIGGQGVTAEEQSVPVHRFAGREFTLTKCVQEYGIFYIGYESPTLNNIMMNFSQCKVGGLVYAWCW